MVLSKGQSRGIILRCLYVPPVALSLPTYVTGTKVQFVEKYGSLFHDSPNNAQALTHDDFEVLFKAVRAAGWVEPSLLMKSLHDLSPDQGLSGLIDRTDSGDPLKSAVILRLDHGQITSERMYPV